MKRFLTGFLLFFPGLYLSAQQTLSLKEFLQVVRTYHPVARQAALEVAIAKTEVTSARGGFDPRFENSISRKEFDGLLYYDHQISEVKIPTWYGVDIVAGIESLSGQRTSTPDTKGNSSYLGINVPLAKGLITDSRRAALQQAKIFQELTVQEQRAVVNDLLFDAAKAYWSWWQQHQVQRLFQRAVSNAEERFRLVKNAFLLGERPAIDTIEALAQWQNFQITANELQLGLTNAQFDLNVFLWQENGDTYSLPQGIIPEEKMPILIESLQLEQLLRRAALHPELEQYRYKLEALQVEKRLKFQSLLPTVYLKYNQLNKSHQLQKSFRMPWLENNYRYGITISVPLRLSEGRGEYRQAALKIEQTKLEQVNKQVLQQTRVRKYYNEWKQLQQQIALQQQAVQSYSTLQRGEEIKFMNGETPSSRGAPPRTRCRPRRAGCARSSRGRRRRARWAARTSSRTRSRARRARARP
jgi:outer membrane protein TolC